MIFILHINEFVFRDAPIGRRLMQWPFKSHLSINGPDLKQIRHIIVLLENILVYDFDNNWTKLSILLI